MHDTPLTSKRSESCIGKHVHMWKLNKLDSSQVFCIASCITPDCTLFISPSGFCKCYRCLKPPSGKIEKLMGMSFRTKTSQKFVCSSFQEFEAACQSQLSRKVWLHPRCVLGYLVSWHLRTWVHVLARHKICTNNYILLQFPKETNTRGSETITHFHTNLQRFD